MTWFCLFWLSTVTVKFWQASYVSPNLLDPERVWSIRLLAPGRAVHVHSCEAAGSRYGLVSTHLLSG